MAYLEWGFSSAGRAPVLHAGGQGFDPPKLHHPSGKILSKGFKLSSSTNQ